MSVARPVSVILATVTFIGLLSAGYLNGSIFTFCIEVSTGF